MLVWLDRVVHRNHLVTTGTINVNSGIIRSYAIEDEHYLLDIDLCNRVSMSFLV